MNLINLCMEIKINVPNASLNHYTIESFVVSKEASRVQAMRALFQNGRGSLPPGNYKRLMRNKFVMMSNTPDEIRDFQTFIWKATGKILVNGLGLGVLLQALLNKPEVAEITVIEISEDIIKLVAPTYLKDKRVSIIHADAFEWNPPKETHYDCVWHDIWNNICSDNLEGMKKLHRKYERKCNYQASWCRYECEQRAKQYY